MKINLHVDPTHLGSLGQKEVALTFASAAGFTFPSAKKAPPSTTTLFTFPAKEESLLIACARKHQYIRDDIERVNIEEK